MTLDPDQLAALIAAISFAAGLNVYATVATLGLLSRGGVLALPLSLHLVESRPAYGILDFCWKVAANHS